MRSLLVPLARVGVFLVLGYAALLVAARYSYRRFVYPAPVGNDPASRIAPVTTLRAADGVPVHVIEFPAPSATARTLVLFHGNGETIGGRVELARSLVARGFGVTLVEYRGYGLSRGAPPDENGLYLDAAAALDALASRGVTKDSIVLWGTSLGTGVAAEMARRGRGARLVLVSPFTSLPAAAQKLVPFLPMSVVLPDRFDTLSKAAAIALPTLVVHGEQDDLVPCEMGRQVARAIPGARFMTVAGAHHNDVYVPEVLEAIIQHAQG